MYTEKEKPSHLLLQVLLRSLSLHFINMFLFPDLGEGLIQAQIEAIPATPPDTTVEPELSLEEGFFFLGEGPVITHEEEGSST